MTWDDFDIEPLLNVQSPSGYHIRWQERRLLTLLRYMPVVVLTGARQVGKTSLLRHLDEGFRQQSRLCRYVTLDDFSMAEQARDDPHSLWDGYEVVMIDEVQRDPRLLSALKVAVDETRWRGMSGASTARTPEAGGAGRPEPHLEPRFILSGSANLLVMNRVAESLAGRAAYMVLRPFAVGEILGDETPPALLDDLFAGWLPDSRWSAKRAAELGITPGALDAYSFISRGLMPGLHAGAGTDRVASSAWWEGYVATYLGRDLRDLAEVSSLIDFRRVMQALAAQTGRLLNQTEVARDTATPTSTLSRWFNLLEAGHLAERVPAFAENRGQRVVKAPRLYWSDPGLPVFLAGLSEAEPLEETREAGPLFENLIYHHLSVLAGLLDPPARLYHWRTQRGLEVDFVLERGQAVLAFEAKSVRRVTYGDAKGLRAFMAAHEQCKAGILVYRGSEVIPLGSRVVALPWEFVSV